MTWKLACMLRTYIAWKPTVGFSKYEFNNKLLGGVLFFRITSSVTWTQPYIFLIQYEFWQIYREITLFSYIFYAYKFQGNKKLITMSSINGLDSSLVVLNNA